MTNHTIKDSTLIQSTPARIVEALTTADGIRGWWTTDVDCTAREATYRFGREPGPRAEATYRFDAVDERRVAMTCVRENDKADWLGTTLTFTLVPDGKATRVDLVHAGYPANNEFYSMCIKGWAHFLRSLKSYLETGTGQPHVPVAGSVVGASHGSAAAVS